MRVGKQEGRRDAKTQQQGESPLPQGGEWTGERPGPRDEGVPRPRTPDPRPLLIVNADDFGISEGVNDGIVEAHRRGILTSTSAMTNMPAFEHAVRLARENPALGVGVHLNLTGGTPLLPVSKIPDLVGEEGRFRPLSFVLRQLTLRQLDTAQIEAELSAQVERAVEVGLSPTHLDSHHHVHMHPSLQPIAIRIAIRYGIRAIRSTTELSFGEALSRVGMLLDGESDEEDLPDGDRRPVPRLPIAEGTLHALPVTRRMSAEDMLTGENQEGRAPTAETPRQIYLKAVLLSLLGALLRWRARRAELAVPDHFRGLLLGVAFSAQDLQGVLEKLPAGSTELMCHPGYPDQTLRLRTSYATGRDAELAALMDPADEVVLQKVGVRLGTFADLYR